MKQGKIDDYYPTGKKESERWCKNGGYHRLDGPAIQEWYENGKKSYEQWYENGNKHRLDGPAYINWHENGKLKYENFYINGKELTREQFLQYTRSQKFKELKTV